MDRSDLIHVVRTGSWAERTAAIRGVPAEFPGKEHQEVFAEVGRAFYQGKLAPHFHLIPWPEKYRDRDGFNAAYEAAATATNGFSDVSPQMIYEAISSDPASLRIFRLIIGYTPAELASSAKELEGADIGKAAIERMEEGRQPSKRSLPAINPLARLLARVVSGSGGYNVPTELKKAGFRGKTDKPDTEDGWATVERFHRDGVPYSELLYQRFYGGSYRQLQDAGGTKKGDILEDAVEELFDNLDVPYVRTVPGTQATAGRKFGISVQPAPDFIIHDGEKARGLLECKSAGDGGTARDKAGRFGALRVEANRLGGIPVLAVLEGLGWRRLNDALGPVIRDCDGRVFCPSNLGDLAQIDPIRDLVQRS
jgi:hypothetical protein